jgi:hypothetical protein
MKIVLSNLLRLSLAFFFLITVLSSCFHGTSAPPAPRQSNVYAYPIMPPPPPWAPPYEYRDRVRYYYLPDMECYYDVYTGQYVYSNGFEWIHSPYAPPAYSGYDMYNGYVVVLNYGVNDPWMNHATYINSYPRGYYNQNNGASNGNTNSGPRRGYNENDKATLYPKGSPQNTPAHPATNKQTVKQAPTPAKHPVQENTAPGTIKTPAPGMEAEPGIKPEHHKAVPALAPKEEPGAEPAPRPEPKTKPVKNDRSPEAPPKRNPPPPRPAGPKPPPQKQGVKQTPN